MQQQGAKAIFYFLKPDDNLGAVRGAERVLFKPEAVSSTAGNRPLTPLIYIKLHSCIILSRKASLSNDLP